MVLVGLTGLMGSGKTTVLKMFKKLGVSVYNADIEARKLMHSSELVEKVKKIFGEIAYVSGQLNRAHIAKIVFDDTQKLEQLNAIVHPAVQNHFEKFVADSTGHYIVYESALLFQSNLKPLFNYIIVVTAPLEERISRIINRDKSNRLAIEKRLKHQDISPKDMEGVNFIIENTNLDTTKLAVRNIHKTILDS